jgi:carbamoyl-phosphate synthase large subunit
MKVLVTGAGALLGQGIIKSLRLADHKYHIIASDPDPRAVGLYWADGAYLIPLASAPTYLDEVRDILAREHPDAVLIGTDVELAIFAKNKAALEAEFGTHIIVSPLSVIAIADDKWLTYKFLVEHGFPHPCSALPDELDGLLRKCDFPLVVKPRVAARSLGMSLVKNEQELSMALAMVRDPIVQECVATPDDEFTSGLIVTGDKVQAVVTMRRDLRDGNTYRAYVQPNAAYNSLLAEVAMALGGFGPLNFQFRTANGVPKIFEINARFSGTTPLRAYAGFNEVDILLRYLVLGEPIRAPQLRPYTILRYWSEVVIESDQISRLQSTGVLNLPLSGTRM